MLDAGTLACQTLSSEQVDTLESMLDGLDFPLRPPPDLLTPGSEPSESFPLVECGPASAYHPFPTRRLCNLAPQENGEVR